MKTLATIVLSIILPFSTPLFGQMSKETIENIKDANSYFYFEDYEEALPLYLGALKDSPNNAYLQYHIGFCYLNIRGSKDKAIPYLEKASKAMNKNYQEENVHSTHAPYDALFYLANAYFVNNNIAKALETYKQFRNIIEAERKTKWNISYLEHQEQTAKNSLDIQRTPINYLMQNLGSTFNDRFANFNAVISNDEKTIAFTTKRKFYNAIFISHRTDNGNWTTPKNITIDLEVDGNCSTLSLSADGSRLYLFKDENHDGNIYMSKYNGTKWLPMVKLNKNINTQYYETHAVESANGEYLIFTSNRRGGFGDLDIYISKLSANGEWGEAKNLGEKINTPYNEDTPFLSTDNDLLFFSSEGHNNIGGYDIFVAQNENFLSWSTPINLGFPLNTPDDNLFFCPINDGSRGLYSVFDTDGFGNLDICELNLYIPKFMKSMMLSSEVSDRTKNNNYKILVIDTISSIGTALIDRLSSNFDLALDPQKPAKLFYGGHKYNVGEKKQYADTKSIEAQVTNQQREAQKRNENRIKEEMLAQQKIDSLKNIQLAEKIDPNATHTLDTNLNILQSKNIFTQQSDGTNTPIYTTNLDNSNYLTELLLLLAPADAQAILTRILKNDWHFNQFGKKEKVVEFANSLNTPEEKNAMLTTLALLLDYIDKNIQTSTTQRLKNISNGKNNDGFYNFYNQIINGASSKLAELLSDVFVNNPQISSFEQLIAVLKKQYPNEFNQHITELVSLLAQHGITYYVSLSDEEKFNLYTNFEHQQYSRPTPLYLFLILFVLVSITGIVLIRRKKR